MKIEKKINAKPYLPRRSKSELATTPLVTPSPHPKGSSFEVTLPVTLQNKCYTRTKHVQKIEAING